MRQFKNSHTIKSEQDKYFMCYLALKLIAEKEGEIWDEFVNNLKMKKEFNMTEEQSKNVDALLRQQIPIKFNTLSQLNASNQARQNQCKI